MSLYLILHEQPVASDLRRIAVASKTSQDLGRIAHLCFDLYELILEMDVIPCKKTLLDMAENCSKQLSLSLEAV